MANLLILWTLSLSSDKIPIISEISMHLNHKILEQRSLAYIVLRIELVSFGKMFMKKQEIQLHFWSLKNQ